MIRLPTLSISLMTQILQPKCFSLSNTFWEMNTHNSSPTTKKTTPYFFLRSSEIRKEYKTWQADFETVSWLCTIVPGLVTLKNSHSQDKFTSIFLENSGNHGLPLNSSCPKNFQRFAEFLKAWSAPDFYLIIITCLRNVTLSSDRLDEIFQ